jgi:hypothetical protein
MNKTYDVIWSKIAENDLKNMELCEEYKHKRHPVSLPFYI